MPSLLAGTLVSRGNQARFVKDFYSAFSYLARPPDGGKRKVIYQISIIFQCPEFLHGVEMFAQGPAEPVGAVAPGDEV